MRLDLQGVKILETSGKGLIIDLEAIDKFDGYEARDILEMFNKTGILVYQKTHAMGPDYQPIQIIDSPIKP